MANTLETLRVSGTQYTLVDSTAIHSLDGYYTSGQTNDAITAATAALAQTIAEQGYQTSGDVQSAISGKADTTALTSYFGAVNYDSNTKRINFYNTSTGGTVLAYVDATDFIKDGMVDSVEIKTISGASYLAITFNADAGKEEIDIPLTDIFNPANYYDKTAIDAALSGKQDTLSAGTGIAIDANNTISVTGVPMTIDTVVTSGSTNPVQSSGIYNAITAATAPLQSKIYVSGTTLCID